jgi:hypothetical protein
MAERASRKFLCDQNHIEEGPKSIFLLCKSSLQIKENTMSALSRNIEGPDHEISNHEQGDERCMFRFAEDEEGYLVLYEHVLSSWSQSGFEISSPKGYYDVAAIGLGCLSHLPVTRVTSGLVVELRFRAMI